MSNQINEPIEVHNCWTIYGMNPDGTEADEPMAFFSRPQDWGHPRWTYHRFRFEWLTDGNQNQRYINNCHCWTDLKLKESEYPEVFAAFMVRIMLPGSQEQLCGREYLHGEDFWSDEWGEMPPIWEEEWE